MSGNHKSTSNFEKDFLIEELGLRQYRNSTIFTKDTIFVLSPSVSLNTKNYYWFDIREVNLNKFDNNIYSKFKILIRIVNIGFVLLDFNELKELLTIHTKREDSSLKVWGFNLEIKGNSVKIINRKDKTFLTKNIIDKMNLKEEVS